MSNLGLRDTVVAPDGRPRFQWAASESEEGMARQFMDVKETAEYLNVSVQWVYREGPRVGLVPYRFGKGANSKLQFRIAEVQAWVRQRCDSA